MKRFAEIGMLIALSIFAVPTSSAQGSRWMRLNGAEGKPSAFLDTTTIQREQSGALVVWIRTDLPAPRPVSENDARLVTSSSSQMEIDCSLRRWRLRKEAAYNKSGDQVMQRTYATSPWEQPLPDTLGETVVQGVCALASKPVSPI